MTAALLLALLGAPDAHACGGLFCQSAAQPVDQAGERILFAIDADAGEVEVQVQIAYTGTASEFAWILPVPAEPVVTTSVDDVFQLLGQATFPRYVLARRTEGTCRTDLGVNLSGGVAFDEGVVPPGDPRGGGGVVVGSEGLVGPYEQVVLKADNTDTLIAWLHDHGYLVPEALAPKLAPYVADGSWFVALRLQKSKSTGDLVPVVVRYPGSEPVIPLRLTAVAATPDMPLQPFVLGGARAVPANYLHVTVNPFAVDWLSAGSNYLDVVRRAADEAGGQAFATDFAGPTTGLSGTFWAEGRFKPDQLRGHTDPVDVLNLLASAGFPQSTGVLSFVDDLLDPPLPAGNGVSELLSQLGYVGYQVEQRVAGRRLDGDALADALEADWIPAMQHAEELVHRLPRITRLTSSMSADEMTADPRFVLNPDMPDVAAQRDATLVTHCSPGRSLNDAPVTLDLPDGRSMPVPQDVLFNGQSAAWVGTVQPLATESIERTGASGPAEVVTDHKGDIQAAIDALGGDPRRCGCDTQSTAGSAVGALVLALLRRRRQGGRAAR